MDFPSLDEILSLIPERDRRELPAIPKSMPSDCMLTSQYADVILRVLAAYTEHLGDALLQYRPLPVAKGFHLSKRRIRLVTGANQAGKSLTAAAEWAMRARRMHPVPRYEDAATLLMLAVGKDEDHLGSVMWKKLGWPGAFEVIPDHETGVIRALDIDPNDPQQVAPWDLERRHLWRPAGPLIPPNEIAQIAWSKKNEAIPSRVVLKCGAEMTFHTSKGSPRNGIQVHWAWYDEEIENLKWLAETMPRLVRFDGSFIWSATPQASTPQLFDLHNRFLDGDLGVDEYTLLIADNPYFSKSAKDALFADLLALGEEELAVRWYGKYAIASRKVYPAYSLGEHGVTHFAIPDDWMIVAALDPGSLHPAVLFAAVPPDGTTLHIFAELFLTNKSAAQTANEVRKVIAGRQMEVFIIDRRAGIQKSMGRDDRVCDHYAKEFEKAGIRKCRLFGGGFAYGCDEPDARELSVKAMLHDGVLKFHKGTTVNLDRQMLGRYYDKNNPKKREDRTTHDLVDCLEYICAFFDETGIYYRKPAQRERVQSRSEARVWEAFQRKQKKAKRRGSIDLDRL